MFHLFLLPLGIFLSSLAAHSPVSLAAGDHPAAHSHREYDALQGRGELGDDGRDSSEDQRGSLSPAAEAQGASLAGVLK